LCASGQECGGQSCGNRENLNVRHNFENNFFMNNNLKDVK